MFLLLYSVAIFWLVSHTTKNRWISRGESDEQNGTLPRVRDRNNNNGQSSRAMGGAWSLPLRRLKSAKTRLSLKGLSLRVETTAFNELFSFNDNEYGIPGIPSATFLLTMNR